MCRCGALLIGLMALCASAQVLDGVCLTDDFEPMFEAMAASDTSGVFSEVDSVRVTGGDCDSVAGQVYIGGLAFGIPMTATKENSCSLRVVVSGDLVDTTVDMCAAAVRPFERRGAGGDAVSARALQRLLSSGADGVLEGAELYAIDGTLLRKNVSLRSLPAGRYIARLRLGGRELIVPFVR